MLGNGQKVRVALRLLLFWLVVYALLRVVFLNLYFAGTMEGQPVTRMFYWGARIDFSTLFYIHLPFLLYYFFLYDLLPVKPAQWIVWLLLLAPVPFLALNCIDLVYFGFGNRRSTVDLLYVWKDTMVAVPGFIVSYWWLFLGFAAIVGLYLWMVRKLLRREVATGGQPRRSLRSYVVRGVLLVLMAGIAYGETARPIMPATPLLYFPPQYQPLVVNSTATFLYSYFRRQESLAEKSYYPAPQLDSLFSIRRQYASPEPFQRKNVVIFIMESFCKEYLEDTSAFRCETPFLDSLIARGTWCADAYANGSGSNQGIVAILASLPSLTDEPYYYSAYSNNRINGIWSLLKKEGYSTHFFLGASPDHYGFGKFCQMVGIDHYYSEVDFGDARFHDGQWGIYDHQFLPWAAGVLNRQRGPFLATVFNLSTHTPFTVPAELRHRFERPGIEPWQASGAYFDYSLRLFFDSVKHEPWYRNTLFVFTADHSTIGALTRSNGYLSYRIPIFLFDPADTTRRVIGRPVQQLDIVPTILDRLHYPRPFMSFGQSMGDSSHSYVINRFYDRIQVHDGHFMLGYRAETDQPVYLYDIENDFNLKANLLDDPQYAAQRQALEQRARMWVQRYNNSLIQHRLWVE